MKAFEELFEQQRIECSKRGVEFMPPDPDSRVGIALQTLGQIPINGLRHPPKGTTNGWYLWCGEELSDDPAFFKVLCVQHLAEKCPHALRYLGLPPGYRFMIAPGHEDIWFDATLLEI